MKVKFLTGNKDKNDSYVGPEGVISIDLESKNIRMHDGITAGGFPIFSMSYNQVEEIIRIIQNITISDEKNILINSSDSLITAEDYGTIVSSEKIINDVEHSLAMGYATSGNPSSINRTIHLYGETGNI